MIAVTAMLKPKTNGKPKITRKTFVGENIMLVISTTANKFRSIRSFPILVLNETYLSVYSDKRNVYLSCPASERNPA